MAIDSDGSVYVAGASFGAVYNYFEYTTLKYDADGNPLWLARYHDPVNAGDEAVALALDGKGNVYVTGTVCTQFRIIQGCIHWAFGTIKYDPQGRLLWVSRYHTAGDGDDFAVGIAVDAEGNAYVTGRSFPDSSHSNYTTVKYDTSGREIWVARYIGPRSYDRVTAIAVNGQGHVYVTGQSGVDGSVTDYTTIKYTSLGEEVWVARYHGPGADLDTPTALALDRSGNIYVTGSSVGVGGASGYATLKYDPEGKGIWVARYEGRGSATALTCDAEGNVYVTGGSVAAAHQDYATIKYDSKGNEAWVARYHGLGDGADWAWRIALDGQGNVYVTGSSSGLGPRADYATVKYDPEGNELWVARYGGPSDGYDTPTALAVDGKGQVYVSGWSHGAQGAYEFATIKYSQ